jgi:cytochrome P450
MDPIEKTPLPPGNPGLPFVGETFKFLDDGFSFIDDRVRRYGPVFRTRILGQNTAVICGLRANEKLLDTKVIQRDDSAPKHIVEFFGGKSLPYLDGETHTARKKLVMHAFSREALAAYLPEIQRRTEAALARWASQNEIIGAAETKRLAIEVIAGSVVGLEPGPKLNELVQNFETLTAAFTELPIPLPGTAYSRAIKARDAIFEYLRSEVKKHRNHASGDALSRILAAKLDDGSTLDDDQTTLETHHFFLAGYIVFGWCLTSFLELSKHEKVREKLAREIAEVAKEGEITPATLAKMPYGLCVVKEIKRVSPVLHAVFARAKEDFVLEGTRIPKGWMIIWALRGANTSKDAFDDPQKFDPDRFGPGREEDRKNENGFVPQGAGGPLTHRCAGLEYSTVFLQTFLTTLVRGYTWEIPRQDLDYKWSMLPPEPKEGLRLRLKRRS